MPVERLDLLEEPGDLDFDVGVLTMLIMLTVMIMMIMLIGLASDGG